MYDIPPVRITKLEPGEYGPFLLDYAKGKGMWRLRAPDDFLRLVTGGGVNAIDARYFTEKQSKKIMASMNARLAEMDLVKSLEAPIVPGLRFNATEIGTWSIEGDYLTAFSALVPAFKTNSRAGKRSGHYDDRIFLTNGQVVSMLPDLAAAAPQIERMLDAPFPEHDGLNCYSARNGDGIAKGALPQLIRYDPAFGEFRTAKWAGGVNLGIRYGYYYCALSDLQDFRAEISGFITALNKRSEDVEKRYGKISIIVDAGLDLTPEEDHQDDITFDAWGPYLRFLSPYIPGWSSVMRNMDFIWNAEWKAWCYPVDANIYTDAELIGLIVGLHRAVGRYRSERSMRGDG
ncbi:hypothetical protein OCH239_10820 [Roseivivax halodurans JCM 10272]|uniref:Uncharacterized protein n=1 Tax=Roseivivax halodurans JCM 10272 TaxID=1449350 RepID=X7EBK3_9RHOB|nr:hypothetical protein [Roseivivax halodurans]ETX13327.1 hypothetical protein OCH239_10820 [Roseivivax halodurans JCM 10272]